MSMPERKINYTPLPHQTIGDPSTPSCGSWPTATRQWAMLGLRPRRSAVGGPDPPAAMFLARSGRRSSLGASGPGRTPRRIQRLISANWPSPAHPGRPLCSAARAARDRRSADAQMRRGVLAHPISTPDFPRAMPPITKIGRPRYFPMIYLTSPPSGAHTGKMAWQLMSAQDRNVISGTRNSFLNVFFSTIASLSRCRPRGARNAIMLTSLCKQPKG